MKVYLTILFLFFAKLAYASKLVCPDDTRESFVVTLKTAKEHGLMVNLKDLEKVGNTECRMVSIVASPIKNGKVFSGLSLELRENDLYAGKFDLAVIAYENKSNYGATFEICKNVADSVVVTINYGSTCFSTSYTVGIKPWSM